MIYTRTGDGGNTALADGSATVKDSPLIEAIGTIDELNAQLSVAVEYMRAVDVAICSQLQQEQRRLFDVEAVLAYNGAESIAQYMPRFKNAALCLERAIDAMLAELPKMNAFIMQGGSMASAQMHVARTVCRRAERRVVALHLPCDVYGDMLAYINRLSDYLFVSARIANHRQGIAEQKIIIG